jgi:DNA-binding Lrp family transcriptional regulator
MSSLVDKLDIRLLGLLQVNNQLGAEELAEHVPLSPSAIARRLRRLRSTGLIAEDVSVLSPQATGERLSALVHVQLERHAPSGGLDALKRTLLDTPEVQLCLEISGAHDMLLLVTTRGMSDFNRLADTLLAENPAVRRYETSFVKKRIKATLAVPLDEAGA